MNDTLHLFDELLEHDAGSKIFFPLARLYRKQGHLQRAIEIVQKGLKHHPDYLDAQLYLIELFVEIGDLEGAEEQAQAVFAKLADHEKFWLSLRSHFAKSQQTDMSLAAFILERNASGGTTDLISLMNYGISHYTEARAAASACVEPEEDLDADEVTQLCINSGIKTKTMAKLLCAQGEYAQAVRIYDDLLDGANTEEERADLLNLRDQARRAMGVLPDTESDKQNKLFNVLNSLAARLEEKAGDTSEKFQL